MTKTFYVQCALERKTESGTQVLVSWIPSTAAKCGRVLRLKDTFTKKWSEGWQVKSAGKYLRSETDVIKRRDDWKKTRKASDI